MKQAFFLIVISFFFLSSCDSLNSNKKIESFEKTLGVENSKVLSDYVQAFETQVLKNKYPTLKTNEAYSKLLAEKPNSIVKMKLYNLFTEYDLDEYFESQLWYEIYAPVDSVRIENSLLSARFVYMSEDGKTKVGQNGGISVNETNRDSIIYRELSVCYFNNQGKYWQAVESIKDDVPFLEEFYSFKTRWSNIGIGHFSTLVHRNKLDLNDYLVRRIVAVELSKFINDAREPEKNTFANNGHN